MPTARVELPDGTIARFEVPEGTTPDQVTSFIQDKVNPPKQGHSSILPLSMDAEGKPKLDWNEGIIGAFKRAFMLPGDVLTGKVDPNSPEGRDRAMEFGLTLSPAPAAMRAGEKAIPGVARNLVEQKPPVPTAEALKEAATQGYSQARELGVEYAPKAVQELSQTIQQGLEADGVLAELSPKTFLILRKLQEAPPDSVATLSNLDAARKALGHAAGDFTNKTEQMAARRAIDELDGFIANADPAAVVAGPSAQAAKILEDARGNYAAASRSDRITKTEESADLRASAANSGRNADNTIRQRLRPIVDPTQPKNARGYSPEELAAIEGVVRGTPVGNTARNMGNLLGGGGGLGSLLTAGGGAMAGSAAGGSLGAGIGTVTLPAVGVGMKALANAITRKGASGVDEMVRARSPLYEGMPSTMAADYDAMNPALMRALAAALTGQNQQR
jgi:hypothetical protein